MAEIIDGKAIAAEIHAELKEEVRRLKATGITPGLAVILVGDDPASASYVRMKERACKELGIISFHYEFPAGTDEETICRLIRELGRDSRVHGILVQLPLPEPLEQGTVLETIPPQKDVDGLHPYNMGRLLQGTPTFIPCTPAGVQELLLRSGNSPEGKHVVVVGRSNIVGKPLAALLMQKKAGANATVTVCHSGTPDLTAQLKRADIVVAAMGVPKFITRDMVRPGCVVIDVGVNRVEDPTAERGYRLVGDVDFDSVSEVASAITPVPGGVGPMTIAMLMRNTVMAAQIQGH
ncbi:MAG: bifunctional methylenetetrahydrofolate dehydrogenase/methenyltetrahydrofolate cyclohydrolase FolD [candidate division KSB1 bacterium]|nr:bifunctional methylenetetrahydrofolate dehydrogenase/methenyltetrahydrofolate cyclohydrolase FolD [candidate division KSB1 bacterium]